ncbi:hypothetical protein D046_7946A, partial [Vibrio parahaemolyticus V-223/04]
MIGMMITA